MGVLVAVSGVSCFLLSCSLALSLCLEIIRNLEASWVLGPPGAIWKPSWAVLKLLLGPMSTPSEAIRQNCSRFANPHRPSLKQPL